MLKRKLVAGLLAAGMVLQTVPGGMSGSMTAQAAIDVNALKEVELTKCTLGNPIGFTDASGNPIYGGDPSVLVDGDTVYLYVGHDVAKGDGYSIPEYLCYSSQDMTTWKQEGVVLKVDKATVTWAQDEVSAWAGQVAKHYDAEAKKDRYYFYYCTWDATSAGKQSIGVAVSDSATGPFTDIGQPLVQGTFTTDETSGWNDIDPTVWIEKDDNGVEHRYLFWGNGKNYICELNEDMISVKDINGDGKVTFGTAAAQAVSGQGADVISQTAPTSFTEAPWLYRRQDAEGNYYGPYYQFYAYGWREQMAYATCDNLMEGKWTFGKILMPPAATSNTNHMAVFDFKGKTYFIYHNGELPAGSGFRRSPCIAEVHFNEDGSIQEIPETAAGINGTTTQIYTSTGALLSHATFANSSADADYPYKKVAIGAALGTEAKDSEWVIRPGKADTTKATYVSFESENKPGLYISANDKADGLDPVTLRQDSTGTKPMAKKMTFRTVSGLGNSKGVSFESVWEPGQFLTVVNGTLTVTDGTDAKAATFGVGAALDAAFDITPPQAVATVQPTTPSATSASAVTVSKAKIPAKVTKLKAKFKKSKITISWKKVKKVKGYEIWYSQKKNKGYKKLKTVTKTSYTCKVKALKKIKTKKNFYIRVRSFAKNNGKKVYSKYTTIKVKKR